MATISQNQKSYLEGLVKAGGGNGEWAKAQLNGATVGADVPTPSVVPAPRTTTASPSAPVVGIPSASVPTPPGQTIFRPPTSPIAPGGFQRGDMERVSSRDQGYILSEVQRTEKGIDHYLNDLHDNDDAQQGFEYLRNLENFSQFGGNYYNPAWTNKIIKASPVQTDYGAKNYNPNNDPNYKLTGNYNDDSWKYWRFGTVANPYVDQNGVKYWNERGKPMHDYSGAKGAPNLSAATAPAQGLQSASLTPNGASVVPPPSGYVKNAQVDALPIDQQLQYYSQHPDEAKLEIQRAQGVNTDAAKRWVSQLQSAAASRPGIPNANVPNVPNQQNVYSAMTPEQIKADVQARVNALNSARQLAANQQKQGIQTSYDNQMKTANDTRTLEDNRNDRSLSPFSGHSDYAKGMIARERAITDRQGQEALQSQLGNIDAQTADYTNSQNSLMPGMIDDMTARERGYYLQDRASNREDLLAQNTIDNTQFQQGIAQQGVDLQKGQVTGNYVDSRALGLIGNILSLKQLAESGQMDPRVAKAQADQMRQQLQVMGVNPSIVGYDSDYNAAMKNVQSTNLGTPTLGAMERNDSNYWKGIGANQWQQSFNSDNYWKGVGADQWEQNFGADNYWKQDASSRAWNQQTYEQDPNNQDNQYKRALTAKVNQELSAAPKGEKASDFIDYLNKSTFMTKDEENDGRPMVYDDRGMAQLIVSLGLSDAETDKLFSYYNINPDRVRQQLGK